MMLSNADASKPIADGSGMKFPLFHCFYYFGILLYNRNYNGLFFPPQTMEYPNEVDPYINYVITIPAKMQK